MFDIYFQLATVAWVGRFREWLWMYSFQRVYGRPNEQAPAGMKPRMIYVGNVRVCGLLVACSFTHNCKPRNVRVAPQQQ